MKVVYKGLRTKIVAGLDPNSLNFDRRFFVFVNQTQFLCAVAYYINRMAHLDVLDMDPGSIIFWGGGGEVLHRATMIKDKGKVLNNALPKKRNTDTQRKPEKVYQK